MRLNKVSKVYKTGHLSVEALMNADLTLHQGEMVAIIGPSGSGKSTLMHILGLLDRPTSGDVYIDGQSIDLGMSDARLAMLRSQRIGFVFQSFNLLPRLTAIDNVMLPARYYHGGQKPAVERAKKLLTDLGMGGRGLHRPNELSGGEKQRVAIARALLNNPDIVLADEPTGNLDTKSGREVLEILKALQQQNKTVVIITHDAAVASMCQRTVQLLDGQIVSDTASPLNGRHEQGKPVGAVSPVRKS